MAVFTETHDWPPIKAAWLAWQQAGRKPWPNAQQFAAAHGVPKDTLNKQVKKWRTEIAAANAATLDLYSAPALASPTGERASHGKAPATRSSAETGGSPSRPGQAEGPAQQSQIQRASRAIRGGVETASEALLDEALHGKGAARISAAKELLDRAGILKASDNKTESTPYEAMTDAEIAERIGYLYPMSQSPAPRTDS